MSSIERSPKGGRGEGGDFKLGGSRLEFTLWLFSTYAIIGLSVAIVVYAVLVALKRTERKRKFE